MIYCCIVLFLGTFHSHKQKKSLEDKITQALSNMVKLCYADSCEFCIQCVSPAVPTMDMCHRSLISVHISFIRWLVQRPANMCTWWVLQHETFDILDLTNGHIAHSAQTLCLKSKHFREMKRNKKCVPKLLMSLSIFQMHFHFIYQCICIYIYILGLQLLFW